VKQPEMEKQPEKPGGEKQEPAKSGHDQPVEAPAGIVQPMIDDLRYPKDAPQPPKRDALQPPKAPPRGSFHPPQPEAAELDQDPGGGYNPDGTFPQP
jgi:hypothetical protein